MKLRYRFWNTESTAHQAMATDKTEIHCTWQINTMENTHIPPPPQKKSHYRQGKTGNVCVM